MVFGKSLKVHLGDANAKATEGNFMLKLFWSLPILFNSWICLDKCEVQDTNQDIEKEVRLHESVFKATSEWFLF